uniref:7TM_GPCR_Srx domain-containing protein n=1 Tax=Parastrongyloides trichosuri TaxID=131310 RepID=A0A0N4Z4C5_PARTI
MLTFTRDLSLIAFYKERTFELLYYASFAMLTACSFTTSLHCIERIYEYYKLRSKRNNHEEKGFQIFTILSYTSTILITMITQLLGNYYSILNSISSGLLYLTIQIVTFVVYVYTVYKTNQEYKEKTSETAISLPLSYKYHLQQIHKSSLLLTITILCVVLSNIVGCCYTIMMYTITDNAISLIDYALTFQIVVNFFLLLRLSILIFLQKKLRNYVYNILCFYIKQSKVSPNDSKIPNTIEGNVYFKIYSDHW